MNNTKIRKPTEAGQQHRQKVDVSIIDRELKQTEDLLGDIGPAITVFGSARLALDHPDCRLARDIAESLSELGFSVITGGGWGIMGAANQGAYEGAGKSVGLNIHLPWEQEANPYQDISYRYHYFFSRKHALIQYSSAFICLPGGIGTLDELFETLTLMCTGKIKHAPVVLVGREFWSLLFNWIKGELIQRGLVSEKDLSLMVLADTPAEVVAVCRDLRR